MLELHVHPDAQPWLPPPAEMAKIQRMFKNTKAKVFFHPRKNVNTILGRHAEPYAFRAFTRDEEVHVFVDPTETPQSIAWLLAHELTHRMVHDTPTLDKAFGEARPTNLDPAGDLFHDLDPEERFCDGIATNLLGYRLDRTWWRKRTPPVNPRGDKFGAIQEDPARSLFHRIQHELIRSKGIGPGMFEARIVENRGSVCYQIGAPAPLIPLIRTTARELESTGARPGSVLMQEVRTSPGAVGEGWILQICNAG